MIRWVVALGGPPGSGKSTAGRLVASRLGLEFVSAGELFRAEAKARGLDLGAFGRYAEAHPEVDRELDRRMQALARPGRLLEGRVQGPLLKRAGLPVRYVLLTAETEERVRRLVHRDGGSLEATRTAMLAREASERKRYLDFYALDLDREPADLTVDATHLSAEAVADRIVAYLSEADGAPRP